MSEHCRKKQICILFFKYEHPLLKSGWKILIADNNNPDKIELPKTIYFVFVDDT
jgi:hypothetical protein